MTEPHRIETLPEAGDSNPSRSDGHESDHGHGRGDRHDRHDRHRIALDAPGPSPSHPPEIPEDRLDADAIKTIARLRHAGHQAYFVGGCVRDVLLGKTPKDFDVA